MLNKMLDLEQKKEKAVAWFHSLQEEICSAFIAIENEDPNQSSDLNAGVFVEKIWNREGGGGGKMRLMNGRIFEKVGVNTSIVHGELSEEFRASIPGAKRDGKFWAAGISVVAHPVNPYVPAAHMNSRFIITSKSCGCPDRMEVSSSTTNISCVISAWNYVTSTFNAKSFCITSIES